jgi:hypothetical protein
MHNFITYLLASIGGVAVLLAAVTWLSKILVNHLFQKELIKFKSNLEKENQIQLIDFKAKTEILFHEYKENIKNLSEERIKAVKEVHNKFINAYAAYCAMTSIMRPVTDLSFSEQVKIDVNKCIKALNELLECTISNEIYLPTFVAKKIFDWRKDKSIYCDVYGPIIASSMYDHTENKELMNCYKKKDEEEKLFEEIRKDLKHIIGIEN